MDRFGGKNVFDNNVGLEEPHFDIALLPVHIDEDVAAFGSDEAAARWARSLAGRKFFPDQKNLYVFTGSDSAHAG
jgi:hypothetical protein